MMYKTLYQLTESVLIPTAPSNPTELSMEQFAYQIVEFIHERCNHWMFDADACLSQNANMIFRGGAAPKNWKEIVDVRSAKRVNRKPKDVDDWTTREMNNVIEAAGGVATRSNSIFVTGNYAQAKDYGSPAVIIPIGKYHYTWSPDIDDLMMYIDEFKAKYIKDHDDDEDVMADGRVEEDAEDAAAASLFDVTIRFNDLCRALDTGNEILLHADNVLIIQYAFAQLYVYPLLQGKKFNAEAAWERWSGGEFAV